VNKRNISAKMNACLITKLKNFTSVSICDINNVEFQRFNKEWLNIHTYFTPCQWISGTTCIVIHLNNIWLPAWHITLHKFHSLPPLSWHADNSRDVQQY
jgi:hypothetical protein